MSIVVYDLNLPLLKNDDMVKISLSYQNAYCHQSNQFVGKRIESFWTQIVEHNPNKNILKVMVSNYCGFSLEPEKPPLKYQDYLEIHTSHIKEHKRYETPEEKDKREQQVSTLVSFLNSLPEDEKKLWDSMTEEQLYGYWEKHYNILKSRT